MQSYLGLGLWPRPGSPVSPTKVSSPGQALSQLAYYVVSSSDEMKVKAMLDADPSLIDKIIPPFLDLSSRLFAHFKILQLSFASANPSMCRLIASYFEKVYGGDANAEMKKQLDEKFCQENAGYRKENRAALEKLLEPVMEKIASEPFIHGQRDDGKWDIDAETIYAIVDFRNAFDEMMTLLDNESAQHRLNALLDLVHCFGRVVNNKPWSESIVKTQIFEDAVWSFVLRYMPAKCAMDFSQGLMSLLTYEEYARPYQSDEYPLSFHRSVVQLTQEDFNPSLYVTSSSEDTEPLRLPFEIKESHLTYYEALQMPSTQINGIQGCWLDVQSGTCPQLTPKNTSYCWPMFDVVVFDVVTLFKYVERLQSELNDFRAGLNRQMRLDR